jgi:uncharacterized protein YabN with tetrapyrrole methylase and pyrophosphatase domain
LTPESRAAIESADELLHLASDELGERWLDELHPRSRSLRPLYRPGRDREEIYEQIVELILDPVRRGRRTCAAFYGHPGVFVRPSHEAVRRARSEGFEARMLPAVSAEDCLFAELGVDPATTGCASYEATDFLLHPRPIDTAASLVLWQVTVIGAADAVAEPRRDNLRALVERLEAHYPSAHEVVVYEASPYPGVPSAILQVRLDELAYAALTPLATLYVPPATPPERNRETAARLGLAAR